MYFKETEWNARAVAPLSIVLDKEIEAHFFALIVRNEISRYPRKRCKPWLNLIKSVRIVEARGNVVYVMARAVSGCKRERVAPPAIHMAAGNARIAAEWAALIRPANPPPKNDE
jgi:hypothetical protein